MKSFFIMNRNGNVLKQILMYKAECLYVCLSPKIFRTVNSVVTKCTSALYARLIKMNETIFTKKKLNTKYSIL